MECQNGKPESSASKSLYTQMKELPTSDTLHSSATGMISENHHSASKSGPIERDDTELDETMKADGIVLPDYKPFYQALPFQ